MSDAGKLKKDASGSWPAALVRLQLLADIGMQDSTPQHRELQVAALERLVQAYSKVPAYYRSKADYHRVESEIEAAEAALRALLCDLDRIRAAEAPPAEPPTVTLKPAARQPAALRARQAYEWACGHWLDAGGCVQTLHFRLTNLRGPLRERADGVPRKLKTFREYLRRAGVRVRGAQTFRELAARELA